jgi:hypothetical protein
MNQGLFAALASGSSVRNLFLENVRINAYETGGALAGRTETVMIENCGMTGSVVVDKGEAGGLIGSAHLATDIRRCFSMGSVEGDSDVGGLVGAAFDNTSILNSFSRSDSVANSITCGGLVGYVRGAGGADDVWITDSYSAGQVSSPARSGGLVGFPDDHFVISRCYYDQDVSGQSDDVGAGVPKTTSQMKSLSTFSGWDFDDVWAMDSGRNDGYPYLQWAEAFFEEEDEGGSSSGCSTGILDPLFLLLLAPLALLLGKSR